MLLSSANYTGGAVLERGRSCSGNCASSATQPEPTHEPARGSAYLTDDMESALGSPSQEPESHVPVSANAPSRSDPRSVTIQGLRVSAWSAPMRGQTLRSRQRADAATARSGSAQTGPGGAVVMEASQGPPTQGSHAGFAQTGRGGAVGAKPLCRSPDDTASAVPQLPPRMDCGLRVRNDGPTDEPRYPVKRYHTPATQQYHIATEPLPKSSRHLPQGSGRRLGRLASVPLQNTDSEPEDYDVVVRIIYQDDQGAPTSEPPSGDAVPQGYTVLRYKDSQDAIG